MKNLHRRYLIGKVVLALAWVLAQSASAFAMTTQSDGITMNPDHSSTITMPVLLRGNETLRLWGHVRGVCALFGFDGYLEGSFKDETLPSSQSLAVLNPDGSYAGRKESDEALKEVTCYHEGGLILAHKADSIAKNPDGSYTIYQPSLLRGNEEIRLWGHVRGVCALFGFEHDLEGSYKDERLASSQSLAVLNRDGSYAGRQDSDVPLKEVTCYHEGELSNVGSSGAIAD